jgi:hypothetical protein
MKVRLHKLYTRTLTEGWAVWNVDVSPSKLGVFFSPKANQVLFWEKRNCDLLRAGGGDEGQVIPQEESKLQGGSGGKHERNDWMKRRRGRGQHFTLVSGGGMGGVGMMCGAALSYWLLVNCYWA